MPKPALPVIRSKHAHAEKRPRDDRISAGVQPRGRKCRRLLPEYQQVLSVRGTFAVQDPKCRPGHKWQACTINGTDIPDNAQTVRVCFAGESDPQSGLEAPTRACLFDTDISPASSADVYIGSELRLRSGRFLAASLWANPYQLRDCKDIADCLARFDAHLRSSPHLLDKLHELSGCRLLCTCRTSAPCHADAIILAFRELCTPAPCDGIISIGTFQSPAEFALAALCCRHPFEDVVVPSPLVDALIFRMSAAAAEIVGHRQSALQHWTARAQALSGHECSLHDAMHADVRGIMNAKRILVFSEMLESIGFPSHAELIHCMSAGFPVVGEYPRTGVFPPALREATFLLRTFGG